MQSALLSVRLADAGVRGCDLAVITTQPGSKSMENAQRQGFELLYARAMLVKNLRRPQHHWTLEIGAGGPMQVVEAQREVRTVYLGGFVGQLVSGVLWLVSSALATWSTPKQAILALFLGGTFIFPLTTLVLRLAGRSTSLSAENPLGALGMQIAFTVPIGLLVALAAAGYKLEWFYPACMLIVGAHYLPFVFLYGMRTFAVLAAVMVGGGVTLALYGPASLALGGWSTAALLIVFAFVLRSAQQREVRA